MKKLKQALSLTLALVLSLSLAVPAFAAEYQEMSINLYGYDAAITFSAAKLGEPVTRPYVNEDEEENVSLIPLILQPGSQVTKAASIDDLCGLTFAFERNGEAISFTGLALLVVNGGAEEVLAQAREDIKQNVGYGEWPDEADCLPVIQEDDGTLYWLQLGDNGSAAPAEPETPAQPAEQPAASGSANYKVNTSGGTALNVRTGPGVKYKKAAPALPQGTEVEIVETDGDWGKLADGSGWVYMLALDKLAGAAQPETPVVPAAPEEIPEDAVTYTVKEGDTLGFISINYYGSNAQSAALYKANKAAFQATKGKLVPGMTLVLPAAIGKTSRIPAPVAGEGEKLYTVQQGDTLGKIAAAEYGSFGDYKAIFERNQDRLKNANTIYVGQVIVLPVIEK